MKWYKSYLKKYEEEIDFTLYVMPLLMILHIVLIGRQSTKLMFSEIFIYWFSLFCASYVFYKLFGNNKFKTTAAIGISATFTVWILGTYDFIGSIFIIASWAFLIGLIPGFSLETIKYPVKTQKTLNKIIHHFTKK